MVKASIKRKGTSRVEKKAAKAEAKLLKVKAGMKYRGARAAWYEALSEYDGKPVDAFLEATAKKAPSLTKKGEAEKPSGWLSFFQRTGVASLQ